MKRIVKVNMLLEYTLTEDGQPEEIYTNGQPVLSPTAEGAALAESIGWQLIYSWAQAAEDKALADAAQELYNNSGSALPMAPDSDLLDFAEPFNSILVYAEGLMADLQAKLDNNLTNQTPFQLAEGLVSARALGAVTHDSLLQVWAEGYYAGYQQGEKDEAESNKSNQDAALGL